MADYPDELRELVDDYLGGLSFGDDRGDRRARGGDGATRCWRAASGSARCCAWRRRARPGPSPRRSFPLRRRSSWSIRTRSSMTTCRRWTTTTCGGEGPRRTRSSARTWRSSPATGSSPKRSTSSSPSRKASPRTWSRRFARLAAATGVGGMVGGQYIDVAAGVDDADGLRKLHGLKTGRLIAASVLVPLHLAGVSDDDADALQRLRR